MKVDITQLLIVFDELMPVTNEEQGTYWFKTVRSDGLIITFTFSIYENYVDIIIHNTSKVDIASLSLEKCSEIKVLDEKKKNLEIVHDGRPGRCFLQLTGDTILSYDE